MVTGYQQQAYRDLRRIADAGERIAKVLEERMPRSHAVGPPPSPEEIEQAKGFMREFEQRRFDRELAELPDTIVITQHRPESWLVSTNAESAPPSGYSVDLTTRFDGFPNRAAAQVFLARIRREIADDQTGYYAEVERILDHIHGPVAHSGGEKGDGGKGEEP